MPKYKNLKELHAAFASGELNKNDYVKETKYEECNSLFDRDKSIPIEQALDILEIPYIWS